MPVAALAPMGAPEVGLPGAEQGMADHLGEGFGLAHSQAPRRLSYFQSLGYLIPPRFVRESIIRLGWQQRRCRGGGFGAAFSGSQRRS